MLPICDLAQDDPATLHEAHELARVRNPHCGVVRAKYDDPNAKLEVNHKVPRAGAGYGWGCWHHLDGLETLCRPCHRKVTNAQALERKRVS